MTARAILRATILIVALIHNSPAQAQSWDLPRLSKQYRQATVFIHAEIAGRQIPLGTGFVVSPAGYVLTAAHVLTGCAECADDSYRATIGQSKGGDRFKVVVIARDDILDIALLRLNSTSQTHAAVSIGNSDRVNDGDALFVLGFPLREEWLAAPGVLSSTAAEVNRWTTTLPLHKGISGGPVFDARGLVVGIARSGTRDSPLTTVIPIREAKNLLRIARVPSVESSTTGSNAPLELVVASRLQREAGEYSGSWKLLGEALASDPDSREARAEQLVVAMEWLRNIRVSSAGGEKSFSEIVDKVAPALYRAAATASGPGRADLLAHLGWASFLKWRDGVRGVAVDKQYRDALAVDPENVYAHAMLAHWMLYPGSRVGTPAQAGTHFAAALRTPRSDAARAFVRQLQISAWGNRYDESGPQLIRLADDMRRNGDVADDDQRSRILSYAYTSVRSTESWERLTSVLSPADHLATLLWLTEGMDIKGNATYRFCIARVTEVAGDGAKALELYRSLHADSGGSLAYYIKTEVEQAITRLSGAPKS